MIRLSRLADYAVVLMCEMARAPGAGTFSARQLHEQTHISQPAIMKLLKMLAGAGLVRSTRGASGGYALAYAPEDISMFDIVKAIDGPVAITMCSHEAGEPCAFEAHCTARSGWRVVNRALQNTLAQFSIADFMHAHQDHNTTTQTIEKDTVCIPQAIP